MGVRAILGLAALLAAAAACSGKSELLSGGTSARFPVLEEPGSARALRVLAGHRIEGSDGFVVNRLGYRGAEPAVAKAPGSFRVSVVGGPFAFGRGVASDGATVGSQLQGLLARNVTNRRIDVVTAGTGARADRVGQAILESDLGLDVSPDLLIWILEPLDDADGTEGWALPAGMAGKRTAEAEAPATSRPAVGTAEWAQSRDALARQLAEHDVAQKNDLQGSDAERERVGPTRCLGLEMHFDRGLPAAVQAVSQRCAERKIAFVAAILPPPLEADVELRALYMEALREQRREPAENYSFQEASALAAAIRAAGCSALDLSTVLREGSEQRREPLLDLARGRWNEKAGGLIAASLGAHIVTSVLPNR